MKKRNLTIYFLRADPAGFDNLGTQIQRLVLDRLSSDWQQRYGHSVLVVETFVDPEQFCGTVYTANGWSELGKICQRPLKRRFPRAVPNRSKKSAR